ncbi:hypothetical protein NHX12_002031 [Muraenolepis orangiensis]|uniref:Reverse transcriptase n=1 Tax=Muraenolepis orangiensis TaxID=630683 RepID=A0A9Q0E464_9TELE|nr:hypothetical protein NHX12_002031 [Muraenolepis orangiensis]
MAFCLVFQHSGHGVFKAKRASNVPTPGIRNSLEAAKDLAPDQGDLLAEAKIQAMTSRDTGPSRCCVFHKTHINPSVLTPAAQRTNGFKGLVKSRPADPPVLRYIENSFQGGEKAGTTFLDLTAAYDTV